jgi:hypothetical protein
VQPAETGLLRAELRPPAGQELTDLAAVVHAFEANAAFRGGGIPCQYQLHGGATYGLVSSPRSAGELEVVGSRHEYDGVALDGDLFE